MTEITLDPVPIVSTIEQFLKNRFLSSQPTHSDRIQRLYRQREMPRPILTQGPRHISVKTRYCMVINFLTITIRNNIL